MKKNKDGKVIASLTEVKNKTGDIFALADQFGEVILTSYNKPRYKIVKIGIEESISFETDTSKPSKKSTKVIKQAKQVSKPKAEEIISHSSVKVEEKIENQLFNHAVDIIEWDRNNAKEKSFVENSTKSLIS